MHACLLGSQGHGIDSETRPAFPNVETRSNSSPQKASAAVSDSQTISECFQPYQNTKRAFVSSVAASL
jgi:hypothetical protein